MTYKSLKNAHNKMIVKMTYKHKKLPEKYQNKLYNE